MKWEYTLAIIPAFSKEGRDKLATFGEAGWELVQIGDSGMAVFKRPLQEEVIHHDED